MNVLIEPRNAEVFEALSFGEPRVCLVTKDKQYAGEIAVLKGYDKETKNFIATDNQRFAWARLIKSTEELDTITVDLFAEHMKLRLDEKRQEGRGGWHKCSEQELSDLLTKSLEKGNPVDIANFCAFLFMRGFDYNVNPQV